MLRRTAAAHAQVFDIYSGIVAELSGPDSPVKLSPIIGLFQQQVWTPLFANFAAGKAFLVNGTGYLNVTGVAKKM